MSSVRSFTLAIAALGSVGALLAQDNAAPPAPATTAPPPAATAPPPATPPAATPPAATPPAATPPADVPTAPGAIDPNEVFIPTQELGADEQVTFPVDI
jgi:hypothetical protein